jgi:hypothetical protein
MAILLMVIQGYFINAYSWLFLLMIIIGYYINDYC